MGSKVDDDVITKHYEKMAAELADAWDGEVHPTKLGHHPVSDETVFPFQVLGHSEGIYYFLGMDSKTVVGFAPEQLSKNRLMSLVSLQYWERYYGGRDGIKWDLAINSILANAHKVGIYDPSRVRGRGAWYDSGKPVLHLGDSVVTAGIKVPIIKMRQGRYIYQLSAPLEVDYDDPLDSDEASEVIKIMETVSWENPLSANLLAGWCVLAPICGALEWRPHLWLSGSKGCGKSWVVDKIVRRLMGNLGLNVQSATTEAGIRQTLGHDALAVTFDEAESNSPRAGDRIQMVLELMRQASSDSGSRIVKGSASGAARSYNIRSCFLMSSIGVGIKQAADASRVSILSIVKRKDNGEFSHMQKLIKSVLTEEYVKRFIARSISLIPEIRANAATFAKAAAGHFGSQRAGDQIGALLAGWYAILRDDVVTMKEAEEWIVAQDWSEHKQSGEDSDEESLYQHLLAQVIDVESRVWRGKRSIGEIVAVAAGTASLDSFSPADAAETLGRIGMKVESAVLGVGRLVISNTHPGIGKLLSGTQWANAWGRILARSDGAKSIDTTRFAAGHRSRAVSLPLLEG